MMKSLGTLLILCLLSCNIFGQSNIIEIVNPSFEDFPTAGKLPVGWHNYSVDYNTPPDTQPGSFGVETQPQHGYAYVGMVTRRDGSNESFYQKLKTPMRTGECYTFDIYLARSLIYLSPTRFGDREINFVEPLYLMVKGTDDLNYPSTELARSTRIIQSQWGRYSFYLSPEKDINYIIFEASVELGPPQVAGNILLDNMSHIKSCNCSDVKSGITKMQSSEKEKRGEVLLNNEDSTIKRTPFNRDYVDNNFVEQDYAAQKKKNQKNAENYVINNWAKVGFDFRKSTFTNKAIQVLTEIEDKTKPVSYKKVITIGVSGDQTAFREKKEALESLLLRNKKFDWLQYYIIPMTDVENVEDCLAVNDEFSIEINYFKGPTSDETYFKTIVENNWEKVYFDKEADRMTKLAAQVLSNMIRKQQTYQLHRRFKIGINTNDKLKEKRIDWVKRALKSQGIKLNRVDFIDYNSSINWLVKHADYAVFVD